MIMLGVKKCPPGGYKQIGTERLISYRIFFKWSMDLGACDWNQEKTKRVEILGKWNY